MKKILLFQLVVLLIFGVRICKGQDTIRYPFKNGINITFSEALQKIGNDWMHKDNDCSTGLYFVEVSFDRESKTPQIFLPDNLPRKFADSVRMVFKEYLFIWDISIISKLSTPIIQPIYIDDVDCFAKQEGIDTSYKNVYLKAYSRELISIQESVRRFFEKTGNITQPRRYYILELCIIKDPPKPKRWSM